MVRQAHRLTYDDYLRMPDDGRRYEILQGELFVTAAPSRRHQTVLANLFRLLDDHIRRRALGWVYFAPFAVRVTPDEPLEPDLVYVSRERAKVLTDSGVNGVPDLVVEVTSSSTDGRDRVTKFNRTLRLVFRNTGLLTQRKRRSSNSF